MLFLVLLKPIIEKLKELLPKHIALITPPKVNRLTQNFQETLVWSNNNIYIKFKLLLCLSVGL